MDITQSLPSLGFLWGSVRLAVTGRGGAHIAAARCWAVLTAATVAGAQACHSPARARERPTAQWSLSAAKVSSSWMKQSLTRSPPLLAAPSSTRPGETRK